VVTIASLEDVRNAGNFSKKIENACLTFYLTFTSFWLKLMIGEPNYDKAVAGTLDPITFNERLKYAEALLAVSYALPSIGVNIAEAGMLKTASVGGRGGEQELVSFTREILALATNFSYMAHSMIPDSLISNKKYKEIWFEVTQRVFPGLDEFPTVAMIASTEEELIKAARGDKKYVPEEDA
jgi:hypothetical protein